MKFNIKQTSSILIIIFGILILAFPDILERLLAIFFITWGVFGLLPKEKAGRHSINKSIFGFRRHL